MLPFNEAIVYNGINKDVAPGGMDYAGRRVLNPWRDLLNGRVYSSESGNEFMMESIKGTERIFEETASGVNQVIGCYGNLEKNILIYFVYNSLGSHKIKKYNLATGAVTSIISGDPALNFSSNPRYAITGVGMVGDILIWTDNLNPTRYINITRVYGTPLEPKISLIKSGPKNPPTFTVKSNDTNVTFNRLASDSFQFAWQYVYIDNEESVMSPYSKLCFADLRPNVTGTARAKVFVTHTVDSEIKDIIKKVRLLYRKNNDANWYVWKEVNDVYSMLGLTIQFYFFNNEQGNIVPVTTTTKLFDSVPNKAKALTIFRGRCFLNINEEGHSFTPPIITVTVGANDVFTSGDVASVITNLQYKGAFLKKNGTYLVGVYFRDEFGRLTGVVSKAYVNGKEWRINNDYDANVSPTALDSLNAYANKINISLSGSGLPGGQYFIAITEEQNYSQYMQVPAHIFFYMGNGGVSENGAFNLISADVHRFYRRGLGTGNPIIPNGTYPNSFTYVHFLLPRELPFAPDTDCYVRLATGQVTVVEKVLDVIDGDIIVTGNFGFRDYASWVNFMRGARPTPLIEVFKLKNTVDPFFYQVLGPYNVSDSGVLSTTSFTGVDVDTYYLPIDKFTFRDYDLDGMNSYNSAKPQAVITPNLFYEAKSPTLKKANVGSTILDKPTDSNEMFAPDLTRSAWGKGVSVIEQIPQVSNRPATLRFSDVFIEGSNINGLNSFPFDNIYDKVGQDRSPITKLVPVGQNLMAVHERHITTLYIGEGILKAGADDVITRVENVVGDDRKMLGDYGSYHPESVQEVDGLVFGWDIFNGVIWRYTVEGVVPVSDNGMTSYFREKALFYFEAKDTLKFISAVDKYHKEYLITLPAYGEFAGETWAFNYVKNQWVHRYPFVPEFMAHLGKKVFGFESGSLWEFNATDTHNNFFGVQYERQLTVVANPAPGKVKVWSAVQISAESVAADETGAYKIFEAENDEGQETYTRVKEFDKKEGVYYGSVLKDVNTNPALLSGAQIALRDGKDMRSKTLEITIHNNRTDKSLMQKINILGEFSEFSA